MSKHSAPLLLPMILVLALLLLLGGFFLLHADDFPWEHLHPEAITLSGCEIESKGGLWYTTVWLDHKDVPERTKFLLSIRKKDKDAMKDCSRWLAEVRKRIQAIQRRMK